MAKKIEKEEPVSKELSEKEHKKAFGKKKKLKKGK